MRAPGPAAAKLVTRPAAFVGLEDHHTHLNVQLDEEEAGHARRRQWPYADARGRLPTHRWRQQGR